MMKYADRLKTGLSVLGAVTLISLAACTNSSNQADQTGETPGRTDTSQGSGSSTQNGTASDRQSNPAQQPGAIASPTMNNQIQNDQSQQQPGTTGSSSMNSGGSSSSQ